MRDVKTVLVTGSAGFVGRKVVGRLLDAGHAVHGIDTALGPPLREGYRHIDCDIRDFDAVRQAMEAVRPGAVVHAAAIVGADAVDADPPAATHVNVLGTHHLLEAFRRARGRRFVHLSSQDVYGNFRGPISEEYPCGPVDFYGLTKQAAEGLVRRYGDAGRLETVNLRGAWIYGPGMARHKFPASAVAQALADRRVALAGGQETEADFIHIDDVCELVLRAIHADPRGYRDFNMGSGAATRVAAVCELIARGAGGVPCEVGPGRLRTAGGAVVPKMGPHDMTRAEGVLGHRPAVRLAEGIDTLFARSGAAEPGIAEILRRDPGRGRPAPPAAQPAAQPEDERA